MTTNERMNALKAAGFDTDKYYMIQIPKSALTEDKPIVINVMDEIEKEIKDTGYTSCTRMYRRWICAQMLRILKEINYGSKDTFNHYVAEKYDTKYMLRMVEHEVHVLAKLQKEDEEAFREREVFFSNWEVHRIYEYYLTDIVTKWNSEKVHKCKGVPYKKLGKKNIFENDANNMMGNLKDIITNMYTGDYSYLEKFCHTFNSIILPYGVEAENKKEWIECFKGAGSYYTLKNLVLFHNMPLETYGYEEGGETLRGEEAFKYMRSKLNTYKGYQWFAMLKKALENINYVISIDNIKKVM